MTVPYSPENPFAPPRRGYSPDNPFATEPASTAATARAAFADTAPSDDTRRALGTVASQVAADPRQRPPTIAEALEASAGARPATRDVLGYASPNPLPAPALPRLIDPTKPRGPVPIPTTVTADQRAQELADRPARENFARGALAGVNKGVLRLPDIPLAIGSKIADVVHAPDTVRDPLHRARGFINDELQAVDQTFDAQGLAGELGNFAGEVLPAGLTAELGAAGVAKLVQKYGGATRLAAALRAGREGTYLQRLATVVGTNAPTDVAYGLSMTPDGENPLPAIGANLALSGTGAAVLEGAMTPALNRARGARLANDAALGDLRRVDEGMAVAGQRDAAHNELATQLEQLLTGKVGAAHDDALRLDALESEAPTPNMQAVREFDQDVSLAQRRKGQRERLQAAADADRDALRGALRGHQSTVLEAQAREPQPSAFRDNFDRALAPSEEPAYSADNPFAPETAAAPAAPHEPIVVPEEGADHDTILQHLERTGGIRQPGSTPFTPRTERTAHIILGLPGSGKSKLVAPALEAGGRLIDADEVAPMLGGYNGGAGRSAVQEDASALADELTARAIARGENVVLPRVGRTLSGIKDLVESLHAEGYDVHLALNDASVESAIARAQKREARTGRRTAADYIRGVGTAPRETFEALKEHPGVTSATRFNAEVPHDRFPEAVEGRGTAPAGWSVPGGVVDVRPGVQADAGLHAAGEPGGVTPPGRDVQADAGGLRPRGPGSAGDGGSDSRGSPPPGARLDAGRPEPAGAAAPEVSPALGRPRLRGLDGATDTVTFPDGSKLPVTLRVVEAADLRPSHNAETFAPRDDYPAGVQGRRYHADRAAQENVAAATTSMDPDRLIRNTGKPSGTPLVTPDGVVIGGNQRTMTLQRAAAMAPDRLAAYKELLIQRARQFDVDAEAVRGMKAPVLVREVSGGVDMTDPAALQRLNDLSDTQSSKSRSTLDEGMARAGRLGRADTALEHFATTVGPDESLRTYLDGPHGRPFLNALVADGVVSRQEVGRFVGRDGKLTADAKKILEDTMYGAAVGDADVLQRTPPEVLRRLDTALPAIIRASQVPGYELQPTLREALGLLGDVGALKREGNGIGSVDALRAQGGLFGESDVEGPALAMARFLESRKKGDIAKAFRSYARDAAAASSAGQSADMFGYTPPTPAEAMTRAFESAEPAPTHSPAENMSNLRRTLGIGEATLFSNPVAPALKLLGTRGGTSVGLGALGAAMQDSDDEDIRATGRFVIGLAALHAIGWKRLAGGGGAVGRKVIQALRGSEAGTKVVRFFNPDALLSPGVKKAIAGYEQTVAKGRARGAEFGRKARELGPAGDRAVSDLIEGEDRGALAAVDPKELTAVAGVAQKIADEFDALGALKVQSGVLPQVAVDAHQGSYLPRIYAEYEALDALGERPGPSTPRKPRIAQQKKRTLGATPEDLAYRDELGEVREASYRAERGLVKGYRDVAAAKLFQSLRTMPGVVHPEYADALDEFLTARDAYKTARATSAADDADTALELMRDAKETLDAITSRFRTGRGEFIAMPDGPGMGVLRGMVVQRDVANSLNGLPDMRSTSGFLTFWKKKNTVWNPGTHLGNIGSNVTMAHMAGLPIWRQPDRLRGAFRDMVSYGPATRELAEAGILDVNAVTADNSGAAGGAGPRRDELLKLLKTSRPATVAKLAELGVAPTTWDGMRAAFKTVEGPLAHLYNNEDNIFRVAMYLHARESMGKSAAEALRIAHSDLINFRTRSPAIRLLRGTVSPFVLYPAKALPTFARHVVEHPWRYMGLIAAWGGANELAQSQVGDVAQADLPPAQRRGKLGYGLPGLTQIPFASKDRQGRRPAYDISRFTPISALTTNAPPGAAVSSISERIPAALNPSGPATDLASIALNVDPYTGKPRLTPGMTGTDVAGALGEEAVDLTLPPVLGFQRRRLVEDLRNNDLQSAGVNAFGLLGLRPRYVRPGEYADQARYELEQALMDAKQQLRRGMRRSQSGARNQDLMQDYERRVQGARERYTERVSP